MTALAAALAVAMPLAAHAEPPMSTATRVAPNLPAKPPPAATAAAKPAAAAAPAKPALSPELTAAMQKAETGDTAPLLKLADRGDAEAQYYAGVMYLFGGKAVAKDPKRGCAYVEKTSKTRGDAMHLVGMCYQTGAATGAPDKAKAEAAFRRASQMGFAKSKCALGQMLMAEPARAKEGLGLCEEAGKAGDVEAQITVANTYFANGKESGKTEARKWYEMAARQGSTNAMRRAGEMYARGDGGPRDTKKAIQTWAAAEKAGDPLVAILVADQLFSDMTGGRKPGPGTYGFKGGVPMKDIEVVEEWYKLAEAKDPRPDVKQRAKYGLAILANFKTAGGVSADKVKTKKR